MALCSARRPRSTNPSALLARLAKRGAQASSRAGSPHPTSNPLRAPSAPPRVHSRRHFFARETVAALRAQTHAQLYEGVALRRAPQLRLQFRVGEHALPEFI